MERFPVVKTIFCSICTGRITLDKIGRKVINAERMTITVRGK